MERLHILRELFYFKLLNLIPFSNNTHTRGHRYKLSINLIRKDVFKQYFIFRCIPVWNILPDHYFNTNVTESFKLELTKTDFSQFLYGTLRGSYPLCSP